MVAANAMGFETKEIPTFEWAQKAEMKPLGLDEIEVRGEKLDRVRRIFVRPNVIPWNRISGVWGNKEI